jgi:hypothetical protein
MTPSADPTIAATALLGQVIVRGAEPYSDPKYWYECPGYSTNSAPQCPLTSRLRAQLVVCCRGGPPILRTQFFTGPPQLESVSPIGVGIDEHASQLVRFSILTEPGWGTAHYALAVSDVNGQWLVDDVMCDGSLASSSDYSPGGPHPFECPSS